MKDRVSKYPGRVKLTPVAGTSNTYDMVRADEPTQTGDPLNKNTFLKDATAALFGLDEAAVPDDVFKWIGEWGQANWKLLAEFNTAGAYTFVVPDDVDELGAFILGGGNAGYAGHYNHLYTALAYGGASGGLVQTVLKKRDGDFTAGEEISVVVGAGGIGKSNTTSGSVVAGGSGGTSSFNGITSGSGQAGDTPTLNSETPAPYGLWNARSAPLAYKGRNFFDPHDTHIYCGAGGFAYGVSSTDGTHYTAYQTTVARTKGRSGAGATYKGGTASAPGDGGGGAASTYGTTTGGNGADGLVLVYGRKAV